MKILGSKLYLIKPSLPETRTYLSEEVKKQMENDLVKQFDRLKVWAIGDSVKDISVGDEVFVDPSGLRNAVALNIEGTEIVVVNSMHVFHIW